MLAGQVNRETLAILAGGVATVMYQSLTRKKLAANSPFGARLIGSKMPHFLPRFCTDSMWRRVCLTDDRSLIAPGGPTPGPCDMMTY